MSQINEDHPTDMNTAATASVTTTTTTTTGSFEEQLQNAIRIAGTFFPKSRI
jgi:hypothetical protein